MKFSLLITFLCSSLVKCNMLNLTNFDKHMFWEEPREGLYEIDVGLNSTDAYESGHIMAFSDLNSDKYTDIITVNEPGKSGLASFSIHLFDITKQAFRQK